MKDGQILMSRSKKKHPFGWLCCNSMKEWKQQQNRKLRRIPIEEEMPPLHKFSNMWLSPSDGKVDKTGWTDKLWKAKGK